MIQNNNYYLFKSHTNKSDNLPLCSINQDLCQNKQKALNLLYTYKSCWSNFPASIYLTTYELITRHNSSTFLDANLLFASTFLAAYHYWNLKEAPLIENFAQICKVDFKKLRQFSYYFKSDLIRIKSKRKKKQKSMTLVDLWKEINSLQSLGLSLLAIGRSLKLSMYELDLFFDLSSYPILDDIPPGVAKIVKIIINKYRKGHSKKLIANELQISQEYVRIFLKKYMPDLEYRSQSARKEIKHPSLKSLNIPISVLEQAKAKYYENNDFYTEFPYLENWNFSFLLAYQIKEFFMAGISFHQIVQISGLSTDIVLSILSLLKIPLESSSKPLTTLDNTTIIKKKVKKKRTSYKKFKKAKKEKKSKKLKKTLLMKMIKILNR